MDREISEVLHIMVAMVTMSVVVALAFGAAVIGKKMGYEYLSVAEELNVDLQEGDLSYLRENEVEVPAATVLALFKTNDDNINKVYLNYARLYEKQLASGDAVNDTLYDINGRKTELYKIFEKNVRSKVRLYIVWNEHDNGYDFFIHDLGCLSDDLTHKEVCPHA